MEYCIAQYFGVMQFNSFENPKYLEMMQMTRALIMAEEPVNKALLGDIQFIEDFTDEKTRIPLSVIQLAISRNYVKGTEWQLTIYDKNFTITELHRIASGVVTRLTDIVTNISRKYSLEIVYKRGEGRDTAGELKLG